DLEAFKAKHPVVEQLLQWKKLQKFLSAFGESILGLVGPDGRLRAHYGQNGAMSGRIITSSPNVQQIPARDEEDLRQCFVARPGAKLVKADLSNIELRILAEMANDAVMLGFFAESKDLHAETAKLMFGLPENTNT